MSTETIGFGDMMANIPRMDIHHFVYPVKFGEEHLYYLLNIYITNKTVANSKKQSNMVSE